MRHTSRNEAKKIIRSALAEGREALLENEAESIASLYGIEVPKSTVVSSKVQAAVAAKGLGFPVAMKILSKDMLHKSDAGGVRLGIGSQKDAKAAYIKLCKVARGSASRITRVLVQKMASKSQEFAVGGVRDIQFGPTVMFGLGGIYVELFKDVSFRLAPLSNSEALEMMKETKAYSLLSGFRGSKPLDMKAAASAIVSVGEIMEELNEIESIDINPLIVYPRGTISVDVRMTLHAKDRSDPPNSKQRED